MPFFNFSPPLCLHSLLELRPVFIHRIIDWALHKYFNHHNYTGTQLINETELDLSKEKKKRLTIRESLEIVIRAEAAAVSLLLRVTFFFLELFSTFELSLIFWRKASCQGLYFHELVYSLFFILHIYRMLNKRKKILLHNCMIYNQIFCSNISLKRTFLNYIVPLYIEIYFQMST